MNVKMQTQTPAQNQNIVNHEAIQTFVCNRL